jgi:glutamyl-tRNA(Gln) amidotransferase subunit D
MKSKPQAGDEISVKAGKREEQGILLESHEPNIILLKLGTGYNIGIKKRDIKKIKVVRKRKKEEDEEEKKIKGKGKPRIEIIITGGTIASSLDAKTGGVKWLTSPSKFLNFYPEILDKVDVRVVNPFMKASENMGGEDWVKLAKIVARALNDHNVKGVIITQGTDFLHYTAAALSFFLNVNKPVVLTYSQKSIDRGSSDARLNLRCAAQAAISDIAEVMLVGHANMNDDFCYALKGNKCRKMHTSRRDTFRPINRRPIAKVWPNKIEIISEHKKRKKGKIKADAVFNDKTALLKFYPGQDPKILDFYKKYKGIVIEMSGLGHVITEGKKSWIPKLKELVGKGVVICAAAQTLYGRLDPFVYSPGRELEKLGIIYLEDMLPETALVKLGWVLGHKNLNKEKVKEMMLKNVAGEFNKRLDEGFLA